MTWKAYDDLAWLEPVMAPAEDYIQEAGRFTQAINDALGKRGPGKPAMLHLACGAGGHDAFFKNHFRVTGVDISPGMLEIAAERNPEAEYLPGDMRTIDLERKFDVVAIPDAMMYMTTREDVEAAAATAVGHLAAGGVLMIAVHTKEEFQNNNFVYTAQDGALDVTMFENNHILPSGDRYEAAFTYLIREKGKLRIENDVHTLGLFSLDVWQEVLSGHGLNIETRRADDLYDEALMDGGEYPLTVFVCKKA
ncbi:class I SAM-dependent methyltransferase [Alteribacter natronophilus]|uniref:class I SAM-dependent methyltransferase n=1 Tax=Alteribacter natronophilus TaxID=2583810 RepID=UPI00110F4F33|nr:class I SAM-dependent methyltransferase [Alteribacter natronophilus]TMW71124.1 class I SAM-dependent methyltransferase [Alteribacter natronophilus]